MLLSSLTTYLSAPSLSWIRNLQGSSYSSIHQFSHLLSAFKLETAALASTHKDITMVTDRVSETYAGNLTDPRDLHKLNKEVVFSLVEPMSWFPPPKESHWTMQPFIRWCHNWNSVSKASWQPSPSRICKFLQRYCYCSQECPQGGCTKLVGRNIFLFNLLIGLEKKPKISRTKSLL